MNYYKLDELCTDIIDCPHTSPKWLNEGIPVIRNFNLNKGRIDMSNLSFVDLETYKKRITRANPEPNDIIISREAPMGVVALMPENFTCCLGQRLVLLKVDKKKVSPLYLTYALLSNYVQTQIKRIDQTGSIVSNLNIPDLKSLIIPVPESEYEIGEILNVIDDKISNNNRINAELESMAKTIYDYWFTQFDFPDENGKPYKSSGGKMVWNEELKRVIPEGWEVFNVGDFCNIFTGKKDVNQSLESGIYKFYSCAPEYRYSNDMLYEGEAILISGNGSYTGRTIFINDAFDLYQRTYACVNKTDKDILLYIYYSMKRFFVPKVSGGTHGSAIPYIVYDDIAKEKIAVNYNVLSAYSNIIKPIQNKILKNERENQQLASLRDWLLPMLMNGQVGFES